MPLPAESFAFGFYQRVVTTAVNRLVRRFLLILRATLYVSEISILKFIAESLRFNLFRFDNSELTVHSVKAWYLLCVAFSVEPLSIC